jgi:hypothetical protein
VRNSILGVLFFREVSNYRSLNHESTEIFFNITKKSLEYYIKHFDKMEWLYNFLKRKFLKIEPSLFLDDL